MTPIKQQKKLAAWLLLFLLAPFACIQPSSAAGSNADAWQPSRVAQKRTDISTWRKSVPGQAMDAFKGQTDVPYSMLTVLAVMADIPHYKDWVFQCDGARLMPQYGSDIIYIHIRGIWPVDDRDGLVRSTLSQDPKTLAITIHSVAAPGLMPLTPNTVRIPTLDNTFTLTPLKGGWTRITFQTFVDPGGLIPAWLANFVAIRAPYVTLRDMTRRMAKPQYHLKSPAQLPKILPGADKLVFPDVPAVAHS